MKSVYHELKDIIDNSRNEYETVDEIVLMESLIMFIVDRDMRVFDRAIKTAKDVYERTLASQAVEKEL